MAFGLAKNPRATMSERIHSYDLWTYFPDWSGLFPGEAIKPGEDLSPHFVSNLGDFATRVRLHKGDIRQHSWNGRPIEILFLDAAKEPGVMLHVVNAFYPFLIPGRSIVIQQDLVSAECPWIHIAQEHLAPFFEVIDSPDGGTVCFRLRHRIPINSLPPDFFDELSVATGTRLISTMARRLRGWYALCVYLAGANYVGMKGYKALSLRMVAAVKSSMHYNPNVENDIRLVTERVSASDP